MLLHLLLASQLFASTVLGWTPTGVKVIDGRASGPQASTDGAGGVFISWLSEESYPTNFADAFGARVLSSGFLNPTWPLLGVPIAAELAPLSELAGPVAPGLAGAAYWTWTQRTLNRERDLMLKRTLADGSFDPAWPSGGIDVMGSSALDVFDYTIVPDGIGGAYLAWLEQPLGAPAITTEGIRCQHVRADGTLAPGWPVGGVLIFSAVSYLREPELVPDAAGGVYIKYDHYDWSLPDRQLVKIQHLLANGGTASGWPTGGLQACTFTSIQTSAGPSLISDGAGGVYVAWDDMRERPPGSTANSGDIYMARLSSNATRPSGWPATGRALQVAAGAQWSPRLCPDGSGGALAVWTDLTTARAKLTRVTAAGAQAPGWPSGGTAMCTASGFPDNPVIVSDGQGGAFAGWLQEQGLVRAYAQHFRGDGTPAPGWALTGTLLVDLPNASQYMPNIVPGDPGSAIMVWGDTRDADTPPGSIRAQKLVTDGLVPTQLALQSAEADAHSVRLSWWGAGALGELFFVERSGDGESWLRVGAANTEGTERLTFEDRDVRPGDHLAYRLVDASNRVIVPAAWVEVPRALEFALAGARPNPAKLGALTVELSLAEQASGTLELLDLAGRRVAWRELTSLAPGRHTIPFPETASLAPGMHWLRLRQGLRETTARVVLTR